MLTRAALEHSLPGRNPLVIVHQMGKVASLTWVQVAQALCEPSRGPTLHSHIVSERNLSRLAAALEAPPALQTMVNRIIPRDMVRRGHRVADAFAAAQAQGRTIQLICGIRDPVDRSLSLMSFLADFCGHTQQLLSGRGHGAAVETVIEELVRGWEGVYGATEPRASFEWLFVWMTGLFRNWFTEELLQPFGVDVFATPFREGVGALRLRTESVEALVYRVEDMRPGAKAAPALRAAAAQFFGHTSLPVWPALNASDDRQRSQLFNQQVRREFRLPIHLLDRIYAEPVVQHFYSAAEIAAFRARWC